MKQATLNSRVGRVGLLTGGWDLQPFAGIFSMKPELSSQLLSSLSCEKCTPDIGGR